MIFTVDRKGSVLMVSMWVLAMLVIFAIGLGRRASLNLKLSRLQRDGLRARFAAEAGIKKAIANLKNDQNNYDSLDESWNANQKISFGSGESFTLQIADEERKININTASQELINAMLKESGADEEKASRIAEYICIWRGDNNPSFDTEAEIYNISRKSYFKSVEELMIILDYFYQGIDNENYRKQAKELYENIKGLITVFPAEDKSKVNINTVNPKALELMIKTSITGLEATGDTINADPANLLNRILEYRRNNVFRDTALENSLDLSGPDESDFKKIITALKDSIDIESQNFRVTSTGEIKGTGVRSNIECVFDRKNEKKLYWHEN